MNRRLIGGVLAFALILVVSLELPLGLSLAHNARANALAELRNEGSTLGLFVSGALTKGDSVQAQSLLDRFTMEEDALVLVIESGVVRLSSGVRATEEAVDPTSQPLIASASRGHATAVYGSTDPDDQNMYFAMPLTATGASAHSSSSFADVLLVAEPIGPTEAKVDHQWLALALFGVALLSLAAGLGVLIARSLVRPLAAIESAVGGFGRGDLTQRAVPDRGPPELRELAGSFNEMASRLEELLTSQRAFVADASHQLRSPMTALRLRLENLEGSLPRRSQNEIAAAIAETDRLGRVVDGLLALARAEGTRPSREPVNVRDVLAGRVEAWSPLAEERGVILRTGAIADAGRSLVVMAVPGALEQVLDNLLANALDATPSGGAVELRASRLGDAVEIHVEDTGAGMSPAERARAFDRFWRKDGAETPGTGLGLPIVAQLVRASGGRARLAAGAVGLDAVVTLPSN